MDRPCECRVLDISGAGIRLRTKQHMPAEEVVCLGFHEHVLVIRIRNVRPDGELFLVGAERICSFPVEQFGAGQPTFERLQELMAGKGWDIEVATAASVLPGPPPPPDASRKGRRLPLVLTAAAIVVVGAAGLLLFESSRSGRVKQAVQAPVAAEPMPRPADLPQAVTPALSPLIHRVKLAVLEPAWVTASADGKALLDRGKMFAKDGSFAFDFSKIAYVHLGNSRGVEIEIDGKPVRLAEPHAVVGVLELTPSGSRLLPWTNEDPPATSAH